MEDARPGEDPEFAEVLTRVLRNEQGMDSTGRERFASGLADEVRAALEQLRTDKTIVAGESISELVESFWEE